MRFYCEVEERPVIWTFRKGRKILAMETIEDSSTFQGGTLLQKKVLDATISICAVCCANSVRVTGYVRDNCH